MREYLVLSSALKGFDSVCEQFNTDPAPLLQEVNLPPDVLQHPELMIPYRSFLNLIELAAQKTHCPYFGLELSRHQALEIFGPIAFIMEASVNTGAALQSMITYFHIHNEGADLSFELCGDQAILSFIVKSNIDKLTVQQSLLSCGIGLNIMRALCGKQWNPQRVQLMLDAPNDDRTLRKHFQCPVTFNQEVNSFIFDAKALNTPLSESNPEMHQQLKKYLAEKLQAHSETLVEQVKHLITQMLLTGDANLDRTAELLGISRRQLQRRLKSEQATFKELLDQVRHEQALRYLQETRIPLTELSNILGYAELSVFSRSFKRHSGVGPQAWRNAL